MYWLLKLSTFTANVSLTTGYIPFPSILVPIPCPNPPSTFGYGTQVSCLLNGSKYDSEHSLLCMCCESSLSKDANAEH
jgi:hypothetical protein